LTPATFLSIRSLGVAYPHGRRWMEALSGIDLDLAIGRRLALIGESGSGKSTLALAIAGLLPGNARLTGTIAFPALGRPLRPGRDIGVVFQNPSGSLDPVIAVGEQIAEVAVVNKGLTWAAARRRALDLLERVEIPRSRERMRSFPHEFSGGQRQRIAIAAALAANPPFLIADEPTSALDPLVQRRLVDLLDSLVREERLTLIFVTHDIALASELADEVAVLRAGHLVEAGPASRVFAAPAHPYTKALLATRLDLDMPLGGRLPEIDPADLSVRVPARSHG
jgi:peptide/nickel transport system ATP-binding protein